MPSQVPSSQDQPMPDASNDNGGTTAPPEPVLELGERRIRIVSSPFLVHLVLPTCRLLVCGVSGAGLMLYIIFGIDFGPQKEANTWHQTTISKRYLGGLSLMEVRTNSYQAPVIPQLPSSSKARITHWETHFGT